MRNISATKLAFNVLGFAISAAAIYFFIGYLPEETIAQLIERRRTVIIAGAILVPAYICRAYKSILLLDAGEGKSKAISIVLYSSIALNNLLPLRLGDMLRVAYLNQMLKIGLKKTLVAIILERIVDLLTILLLFMGFILVFYNNQVHELLLWIAEVFEFWWAYLIGSCILLVGIFWGFRNFVFNFLRHIARLNNYSTKNTYKIIVTSICQWCIEIPILGFIVAFVMLDDTNVIHIAATFMSNLATLIPSAPGYVGTFEVVGVLPYNVLQGSVAESDALFVLMLHLSIWIFSTLLGLVFLPFTVVKVKSLKTASID